MSRTPHLPRDLPTADSGVTVEPVGGEHVEPVRGLWGALGFTRPSRDDHDEGDDDGVGEEYVYPPEAHRRGRWEQEEDGAAEPT